MSHSGRPRHRDRDSGHRSFEEEAPPGDRVFRLTEEERQEVAACLRQIDESRRALELQHNAANRAIVRDLRAAADRIFDLLNDLETLDPS